MIGDPKVYRVSILGLGDIVCELDGFDPQAPMPGWLTLKNPGRLVEQMMPPAAGAEQIPTQLTIDIQPMHRGMMSDVLHIPAERCYVIPIDDKACNKGMLKLYEQLKSHITEARSILRLPSTPGKPPRIDDFMRK